ncbi:MAG TPA: hypothetical protein VIY29_30825, partial [Ktedonobacteraceae bacterium]
HHRVIAYDRRSYSRSVAPSMKDLHQHAQDAAALLTIPTNSIKMRGFNPALYNHQVLRAILL